MKMEKRITILDSEMIKKKYRGKTGSVVSDNSVIVKVRLDGEQSVSSVFKSLTKEVAE